MLADISAPVVCDRLEYGRFEDAIDKAQVRYQCNVSALDLFNGRCIRIKCISQFDYGLFV